MKKNICIILALVALLSSCKNDALEKTGNMSVKNGVFSNNYHSLSIASMPVLSIERSVVYSPKEKDWHYAHHPSMAFFKGKFYAVFSNGIHGEDEAGQRVLIATSNDFQQWSWKVLKDTDMKHVLTPGGLFVANDNLLVVYYAQNDFSENGRPNVKLYALTSFDGDKWSDPIDLGISTFPCHCPTRLKSGRLILTGNRDVFYTDDPNGISGWTIAKKADYISESIPSLCEGAILEYKDSIYILFRDTKWKTLLWQEASLNGDSWSVPKKTLFTDNNTKSHFGKLPNNRAYYIGVPDTLNLGQRFPLILSLSDDDFLFNKHYIIANDRYDIKYPEGRWKDGQFGYPYSIIHDNSIYVIVSRRKETIEILKIALDELI